MEESHFRTNLTETLLCSIYKNTMVLLCLPLSLSLSELLFYIYFPLQRLQLQPSQSFLKPIHFSHLQLQNQLQLQLLKRSLYLTYLLEV